MQPVRPRRQGANPFRRPADYVVAVLIVVASLVVGVTLWARSDIHNTVLVTGAAQRGDAGRRRRGSRRRWPSSGRTPSTATPVPVVSGPTVVTAADGAVVGRDPLTGRQRWSYTRDLPLCTVAQAFNKIVAVYHAVQLQRGHRTGPVVRGTGRAAQR